MAVPNLEILIYFLLWLSSILYSMYRIYLSGNMFTYIFPSNNDFERGWTLIGRKKDVSDYEWEIWMNHIVVCIPWFICHLLFSFIIRCILLTGIPFCYSAITLAFLGWCYTPSVAVTYISLLLLFYGVMLLKSELLIWTTSILLLFSLNKRHMFNWDTLPFEKNMLIRGSVGWFILKATDYTIIQNKSRNKNYQKLMDMMAYVFYFPNFHLGPFIPYSDFKQTVYLPHKSFERTRVIDFIYSLVKYIGWIIVFELASHFFYCNAMHFRIELFREDLWTLNGVGYCMGQFFLIKYFVFYGLIGAIAKLEQQSVPPPPRCLHRVHMYSDMWRHFDRGYYLFIFRRIYQPLCKTPSLFLKKLWASFLSFSFVYLWHGLSYNVFLWSLLNFIGVTIEAVGKSISHFRSFKQWEESTNKVCKRRFYSLLCAPLWILAVISNFIFFGGYNVGFLYFEQFTSGSWKFILTISLISYCMCQVSTEINSWLKSKI